jgi:purine-binding chemotaxis protein CheW
MGEIVATQGSRQLEDIGSEHLEDFVTFVIKDQMFGIPVLGVQDILSPDRIASIPLAPAEVKGSINLRGRIVTVIDVRVRLGLERRVGDNEGMGVTVEHQNELYTLLVDKIGDVISLANDLHERNPGTLGPVWREYANGVYRLEGRLMVVLDVERLLDIKT